MLVDHVLFIDSEALVVDKPAGLPVDPPRDGGLSVHNHLQALMLGYRSWPQPVHRLDRDTSGCLVLGRSPKAHKRLSAAFAEGRVTKRYLAILAGVPEGEEGTVTMALSKTSSAEEGWRIIPAEDDAPGAKPAVTHWQVMATADGRALVAFTPEQGRTHQLRVHAASGIGIPILGDPVYGNPHPAAQTAAMMLHAADIRIDRGSKLPVVAHAPFPDRFAALGFADPDAD